MALIKTSMMIHVTFQRKGYHRYPMAPDDVSYLRSEHRHLFKFNVGIQVFTEDREIEFHQFQNWVESLYEGSLSLDHKSCEMISDDLATMIEFKYPRRDIVIEVWEDGECGSVTTYKSHAAS